MWNDFASFNEGILRCCILCAFLANSTGLSSAAGTSSVGAEFGIDYVKVGVILILYIAASSSDRFSPVAALCWRYEMNICAVVGVSWLLGIRKFEVWN